ncbi:hypothetical protein OB13_18245 [Pontibacter sp. HJ8]
MKTLSITFSKLCLFTCLFLLISCKEESFEELAPYKSYTTLLSQKDSNPPVATVLENSLNLTVTWSRISQGKYSGTLSRAVNADKSVLFVTTPTTHTGFKAQLKSPTEIRLEAEAGVNAFQDNFTNVSLELKEYK